MVNTIWKENFLIMCSKLCLNARDSGHFAQLLLICRNYSLQTLCGAPHNVCNEEGKLMGLPLNRALFDDDGHIYDIVSGNFLIVGLGEENFTDLSPNLMEKYGEQFKYPEKFARIAGEIIAVKQPATNEHREKPMMHHSGPDL
jgi:hypothetical protein